MFTKKEIIDLAIQIEENGEAVYRNAGDSISDPAIAALLGSLADDEARHAKWFMNQAGGFEVKVNNPELERLGRAMLRDAVGDKSFSLGEADFANLDQIQTLVQTSIEFENDTILFYEMLQPFVDDPDTLSQLKQIIEEEKRHILELEGLIETEMEIQLPD